MIAETDLQARFLIPMALSLAAGVAFATILMLVLIPNLLVILNDLRRLVHRMKYGEWISREAAEPARMRNVGVIGDESVQAGEAVRLETAGERWLWG